MDKKFRTAPKITYKKVLEEWVILNLETENYYTLNETGLAIWSYCSEPKSLDEIVDFIEKKYEIPRETAFRDARSCVENLLREKLLEPA